MQTGSGLSYYKTSAHAPVPGRPVRSRRRGFTDLDFLPKRRLQFLLQRLQASAGGLVNKRAKECQGLKPLIARAYDMHGLVLQAPKFCGDLCSVKDHLNIVILYHIHPIILLHLLLLLLLLLVLLFLLLLITVIITYIYIYIVEAAGCLGAKKPGESRVQVHKSMSSTEAVSYIPPHQIATPASEL